MQKKHRSKALRQCRSETQSHFSIVHLILLLTGLCSFIPVDNVLPLEIGFFELAFHPDFNRELSILLVVDNKAHFLNRSLALILQSPIERSRYCMTTCLFFGKRRYLVDNAL
jgi:hypothetical protein